MKVKDITKKMLADACDDFNRVMKYETPIATDPANKAVTKATLEKDLREAVADLRPEDTLQPATVEILIVLGVEMPKQVEKVVKKTPDALPKAAGKVKKEKAGKDKGSLEKKYSRAQAFCDALQGEPKTLEEIAQKAMDLHMEANPGKNQPKLSSIVWAVKDYLLPLTILGFVKKTDKKFSL